MTTVYTPKENLNKKKKKIKTFPVQNAVHVHNTKRENERWWQTKRKKYENQQKSMCAPFFLLIQYSFSAVSFCVSLVSQLALFPSPPALPLGYTLDVHIYTEYVYMKKIAASINHSLYMKIVNPIYATRVFESLGLLDLQWSLHVY